MSTRRQALAAFAATGWPASRAQPAGARWPGRGWPVSSAEEQGLDTRALAELVAFGEAGGMDSLLLARNGQLVLDTYYPPFGRGQLHRIHSATQGVVGALVGALIQQDLLDDTAVKVLDLFSGMEVRHVDARKRAMTVQHLLDMTSGLDWQEPLAGAPLSAREMEGSGHWVRFVLDRPMAGEPGTRFNYNSGNAHLLSAIIARLAGRGTEAFAADVLFKPLGIHAQRWQADPQGVSSGGYGLHLLPVDMARIAHLYLRGGLWHGRRLLPPGWTDRLRRATVSMERPGPPNLRYADGWWAAPALGAYMAVGHRRQVMLYMPRHELVAVTTGRAHWDFMRFFDLLLAALGR